MKKIAILSAIAAVLVLSGCGFLPVIRGSGVLVEGSADFTNFTRVEAESTFDIRIAPGPEYGISILCDDNVIDYVVLDSDSETLTISMTPFYRFVDVTLTAEIVMPSLKGVEVEGASRAVIEEGFDSANPFEAEVSGASTLEISQIVCGIFTVEVSGASSLAGSVYATGTVMDISGASDVELRGTSGAVEIDVSGASDVDCEEYAAAGVDIAVSGASDAIVYVTSGVLQVDVSGASDLGYHGTPDNIVINEVSGSSTFYQL